MTKTDTKKRAMLEALQKSLGVVTTACKLAKTSRETHYRWYREDKNYKTQVDDMEDLALDFSTSKLYEQIGQNNTTATIFHLKTKGKKRGWIEQTDHNLNIQKGTLPDWLEDE